MHELSVAQGILDLVRQHVPDSQAGQVRAVSVRVGALSGVVADSLDFCFGAIVAGTPFSGASLAIERVPPRGRCEACRREFDADAPVFRCPHCGGGRITLVSGDELQVVAVELDDPAEVR